MTEGCTTSLARLRPVVRAVQISSFRTQKSPQKLRGLDADTHRLYKSGDRMNLRPEKPTQKGRGRFRGL